MTQLIYECDPGEIYRQSFATIRNEVDLSRFDIGMQQLAIRLIHSCGMVDVVDDIASSPDAFEIGRQALLDGGSVICDVEMVRHGIIKRLMPSENKIVCCLNHDDVRPLADEQKTTRSAAQVELWRSQLAGSVIAIGNAPTALFRLLELIGEGADKPALIIGIPVGFVGAEESKDALIANEFDIPYISVRGRRGGSAMASAAVNALAGKLENHG
jgi:precorrin-8X/cobalt-precorrin-8 methylmutase